MSVTEAIRRAQVVFEEVESTAICGSTDLEKPGFVNSTTSNNNLALSFFWSYEKSFVWGDLWFFHCINHHLFVWGKFIFSSLKRIQIEKWWSTRNWWALGFTISILMPWLFIVCHTVKKDMSMMSSPCTPKKLTMVLASRTQSLLRFPLNHGMLRESNLQDLGLELFS